MNRISRKAFTNSLCVVSSIFTSSIYAKENKVKSDAHRPNIIVILTDDQGYGDMACYGSKKLQTPHLDKMAQQGMRFTDFYAGAASSTPSRAALLTGRYAERTGLSAVVDYTSTHGLKFDELTIADYLKQAGYATAMFGKWHLGHLPEFMPTRHGFTEFFGIPYSNDMWPFHPKPKHVYPAIPLYENEQVVEYNPDINQMTTRLTERGVDYIKKHRNNPFFIYFSLTQPHVPLGVSEKFRGKSGQGLYADVIMEIDWSVGQLMSTLKKYNLSKNTLVIFTSDNGPWLSYGNHAGTAGGLREGKGTTFEGGIRVPFIAHMPGTIPKGTVNTQFVSALDILPTIMDITNFSMPKMNKIDGQSILSVLKGDSINHKPFFFINNGKIEGVRSGKWKLVLPHKFRIVTKPGANGIPGNEDNSGGWTDLSLFDLETNPHETINYASNNPEKVAQLSAIIKEMAIEIEK